MAGRGLGMARRGLAGRGRDRFFDRESVGAVRSPAESGWPAGVGSCADYVHPGPDSIGGPHARHGDSSLFWSSADRRRLNGHFSGGTPQAFRRSVWALGRRPPARGGACAHGAPPCRARRRPSRSRARASAARRAASSALSGPASSARAPAAWIGSFRPAWSQLLTVLPPRVGNRGWNGGPPPQGRAGRTASCWTYTHDVRGLVPGQVPTSCGPREHRSVIAGCLHGLGRASVRDAAQSGG